MGADVAGTGEGQSTPDEGADGEKPQYVSLEGWELTEEQRRFIESFLRDK